MCQNNKKPRVPIHELDAVRSKIFNFHSVKSVKIAKHKTKSSQKQKYVNIN